MAYDVETVDSVAEFIASLEGLSDAGKVHLVNSYTGELAIAPTTTSSATRSPTNPTCSTTKTPSATGA